MKKILLVIVLFGIYGCSYLSSHIIYYKDLPSLDAKYGIGTQIFEWVDSTRYEDFTQTEDDYRRLIIQIWYPAIIADVNAKPAPYLDHPSEQIEAIAEQLEIPSYLLTNIKNISTNSYFNAPIISGQGAFPMLMFSHGLGGMKNQNSIQIEALVHQGYIIVAPDHAYDANITVFNDGTIADFRSGSERIVTEDQFWEYRLPQLQKRTDDINYIYNKVKLLLEDKKSIWKYVNIEKIGIFGHSFGGATSIMAAHSNSKIDAVFLLDAWTVPIPQSVIESGLNVPVMFMGQDKWENPMNIEKLDRLLAKSTQQADKIILKGVHHFDFSDTPHFTKLSKIFGVSGKMESDALLDTINISIISFFNKYLNEPIDHYNEK